MLQPILRRYVNSAVAFESACANYNFRCKQLGPMYWKDLEARLIPAQYPPLSHVASFRKAGVRQCRDVMEWRPLANKPSGDITTLGVGRNDGYRAVRHADRRYDRSTTLRPRGRLFCRRVTRSAEPCQSRKVGQRRRMLRFPRLFPSDMNGKLRVTIAIKLRIGKGWLGVSLEIECCREFSRLRSDMYIDLRSFHLT